MSSNKVQVHQTDIEEQLSTPSTAMKARGILLMYGDDEFGQHISPINKPGPQEIFATKKICGQIYTQEILRNILLLGRFLSRWQRSPLNFSRWE